MANRDNFSISVKDKLSKRVGMICSQPKCSRVTSGPHSDPEAVVNIGVAAHIAAAAPGGPRYDPMQTEAMRKSIENAIWVCQSCAKLIDSDPNKYTVEELLRWKREAEARASKRLTQNSRQDESPREISIVSGGAPIFDASTLTALSIKCNDLYNSGNAAEGGKLAFAATSNALRFSRGAPRYADEKDPLTAVAIVGLRCAAYTPDGGRSAAAYLHEIIIKLLRSDWYSRSRNVELLLELLSLNQGVNNKEVAMAIVHRIPDTPNEEEAASINTRKIILGLSSKKVSALVDAIEIPRYPLLSPRDFVIGNTIKIWTEISLENFDRSHALIEETLDLIGKVKYPEHAGIDPIMRLELLFASSAINSKIEQSNDKNSAEIDALFKKFEISPLVVKPDFFDILGGFGALEPVIINSIIEKYVEHNPHVAVSTAAQSLVRVLTFESLRLVDAFHS